MSIAKIAVYSPPGVPLPYLAVVIFPDHTIEAMAFGSEAEALDFIEEIAAHLVKLAEREEAKKKTRQRKKETRTQNALPDQPVQ